MYEIKIMLSNGNIIAVSKILDSRPSENEAIELLKEDILMADFDNYKSLSILKFA